MKNFILGFLTATLICIGVFFVLNNGSDSKTETETVKYPKSEYTSKNPAPLNTMQTYTRTDKNNLDYNYTVGIRVIEAYRGAEAYLKLSEDAVWDDVPQPKNGYEYVTAKIEFAVLETKTPIPVESSEFDYAIFSYNNKSYVEGEKEFLYSDSVDNLHPGDMVEQWITYQVPKNEDIVLSYCVNYEHSNTIWFALE